MKTSKSYQFVSAFLAILIFISSSGISLSLHYCGNELYEIAFISKIEPCKKKEKIVRDANLDYFQKPSCCDLDEFKINTSQDYKIADKDVVKAEVFHFSPTYFIKENLVFPLPESRVILCGDLSPPPIITHNNIYQLIESYLI